MYKLYLKGAVYISGHKYTKLLTKCNIFDMYIKKI